MAVPVVVRGSVVRGQTDFQFKLEIGLTPSGSLQRFSSSSGPGCSLRACAQIASMANRCSSDRSAAYWPRTLLPPLRRCNRVVVTSTATRPKWDRHAARNSTRTRIQPDGGMPYTQA